MQFSYLTILALLQLTAAMPNSSVAKPTHARRESLPLRPSQNQANKNHRRRNADCNQRQRRRNARNNQRQRNGVGGRGPDGVAALVAQLVVAYGVAHAEPRLLRVQNVQYHTGVRPLAANAHG